MSSGTQQSRNSRSKRGRGRGTGRDRGRGTGRDRGRGTGRDRGRGRGNSGSSSSSRQQGQQRQKTLTVDQAQINLDKATAKKASNNQAAAIKAAKNQAIRNQAKSTQLSANQIKTKDEIVGLEKGIVEKQKQIYDKIGITFRQQIKNTLDNVWKDPTIQKVYIEINKRRDTDPYHEIIKNLLIDIIQERKAWVDKQKLIGKSVSGNYKNSLDEIMKGVVDSSSTFTNPKQLENARSQLQTLKAIMNQKKDDLLKLQRDVFKNNLLGRIIPENQDKIKPAYDAVSKFNSEPLKKIDLDDVYSKFTYSQKANIGSKWQDLIKASDEYYAEQIQYIVLDKQIDNYVASPHLTKNEIILLTWNVKKWLSDKTEDFTSMIN